MTQVFTSSHGSSTDSPPVTTRPCSARRHVAVMLGLTVVCLAVYANSLPNPFMYDDEYIIQHDPRVVCGQVRELLTGNYWYLPGTARHYRPLVMLSYALNWWVSHEAWTFRGVNVALHVGTCLVLYGLGWGVFRSLWAACVAAVLFAVHPIHTEPLNTIVGRADLAAALGVLGSALLYWRDGAPDATASRWRPIVAALLFAASLLCKENAVTLIGVVALLDGWRRRGEPLDAAWWRRRVHRAYGPMALVIVGYLALAVAQVGSPWKFKVPALDNPIAAPSEGLGPGESRFLARWATPWVTFGLAAKRMVWPTDLCCDYSYAAIETVKRVSDHRLPAACAWVVVVAGAIGVSWRRTGAIALGLAIALMTYGIVSNLPVVIGTIFAERLLYLPSAGVCLCAGAVASAAIAARRDPRRKTRWSGWATLGLLAVAAGWFGFLTVDRNHDWRSARSLWLAAERVSPQSHRVLTRLAWDAAEAGKNERALDYANRAIGVAPGCWEPWRIVGVIHRREGRLDEAYRYFEEAMRRGAGPDHETVMGMAELLAQRGDTRRAIELLRWAVECRPLWQPGRLQLAELLGQAGQFTEAIRHLERALEQNPDDVRALNNLAWYLVSATPASLRDPARALTCAQHAAALAPTNGAVIDTHVEVLTALGRSQEAAQVLERALRDVPADDPFRAVLGEKLRKLRP